MVADFPALIASLLGFYDFRGKAILSAGAGGGQFIEVGRTAGRVIAVDNDPAALAMLEGKLKDSGFGERFETVLADFLAVGARADTVLFEFSLHEMPDPEAALRHALSLASDVVVIDHRKGSNWSRLCAEDDKVAAAWRAVGLFRPKAEIERKALQVFADYGELFQKVRGQGEASLERIARFREATDIRIDMPYGLALIQRTEG